VILYAFTGLKEFIGQASSKLIESGVAKGHSKVLSPLVQFKAPRIPMGHARAGSIFEFKELVANGKLDGQIKPLRWLGM
jgi:hypothetical protein